MSLEIKLDREFKKDLERDKQSGAYKEKDFQRLKEVITILAEEMPLDKNQDMLCLARVGTHNQLFNK